MFIRVCCLVKTETLAAGICRLAEAGRCLSGFAVWLKQRHCLPAFVTRRKQEYVLSGFAVCLKQGHWLPAFDVRLKREYGLARLVMTEPSSLAVQNLFRQFFRFPSHSPGKNFFSAPQKITSRPHTFAATGERSFRRSDPVFFRKRRCRDFFHQIIGQQNAGPLRLLFFQYPIAPFFKKRTGGN